MRGVKRKVKSMDIPDFPLILKGVSGTEVFHAEPTVFDRHAILEKEDES